MSILIKMEMPKNCMECLFFESKYHFHGCLAKPESINNINMWNFVGDRPSWCPLIEVPPHGDLIDKSKLPLAFIDVTDLPTDRCLPVYLQEDVDDAPIVVESEE